MKPRYYVSWVHGESGTVAHVIDRKADVLVACFSTSRHGQNFRNRADNVCSQLNRAERAETAPAKAGA